MKKFVLLTTALILFAAACTADERAKKIEDITMTEVKLDTATFGAGCFWCVEAVFQELEGVYSVESGFSGGHVENPSYEQVVSGKTGHAEVARVTFDPQKISFKELLLVFFSTHDPTTLNRQGADVGTQYRSAIFYHDGQQKSDAESIISQLTEQDVFPDKIVTEVSPLENYYKAEDYHQDYYSNNPNQGYCRVVIAPKLEKFRKNFSEKLKK